MKLQRWIFRILEFSLAICLLTIAVIVVTLVILRYVFSSSITGANELITILFVYSTAIGAAVVIGSGEHIAIPFAVERMPKPAQRLVDTFGLIAVAVLNATMIAYSVGWIRVTGDYLMPATGLPRIVVQLCVPIGCGLAVVFCFLRNLQSTDDG